MSLRMFENTVHASVYAKFRPKPPEKLISKIIKYVSQKCASKESSNVAIDVGCGSGQCSALLASHFSQVYGYDVSEAQITEARAVNSFPNINYQVSPAESFPLPDGSIDLITCSQSFHWFDADKFHKEAKRVLKPNGVVALFGYNKEEVAIRGHPRDEGSPVMGVIQGLYRNPHMIKYLNVAQRKLVESSYAEVVLSLNDFERWERFTRSSIEGNAQEIVGYIQTLSSFQKCLEVEPNSAARVLNDFAKVLSSAAATEDLSQIYLDVSFNFFLLLGRE